MAKAARTNKQARNRRAEEAAQTAPDIEIPEGAVPIMDGDEVVGYTYPDPSASQEDIGEQAWASPPSVPYGLDYGEGKTREQETVDSMGALGLALIVGAVVIVGGLIAFLIWA